VTACFCTLAIHEPYRRRARLLCADVAPRPCVVLTDEPADFADLPVRALHHVPTGPMAIDYLQRLGPTGHNNGAAAYHDKRFALQAALREFDTAIFLDADSRLQSLPQLGLFLPGLAVVPVVRKSIAAHLETCGSWRLPAFTALAKDLLGDPAALDAAGWCHETCYAVTRDGNEARFFAAWEYGAGFLQRQGTYSGEGGVMGLAAACCGWTIDYDMLTPLIPLVHHEGGGPKG
jgi:hypothetical protein